MSTPAQLGYRLPGEWEPHLATWLAWPRRGSLAFRERQDGVLAVYARIVRELVAGEDVHINVWDAEMEAAAKHYLGEHGVPAQRVFFHAFPSYEPWCRDHGPVFVVREMDRKRERAVVDWGYNAWGGKYPPYELDDVVPQHVAMFRQTHLFSPDMILEGGSIEANGQGSLLTTESCLLNQNRNPTLNKLQIQLRLKEYLGAPNVLWLDNGIVGDETDGRVDNLARFLNPTTIAAVSEEDIDDANYPMLQENMQRLRTMRDQKNRLFRIVKLPMPGVVESEGQRMPASYLNFYIANAAVLVPTFRRRTDAIVLATLQKEFPDRKVVGIEATDLVWGCGSIHSITQSEPA